jgi:hypothetical protein
MDNVGEIIINEIYIMKLRIQYKIIQKLEPRKCHISLH